MSPLTTESEELLGKVRDALGQCVVQRRRADGLEVSVQVWREKFEAARDLETEARQDNERLRLALQDAERRVKALDVRTCEHNPFCERCYLDANRDTPKPCPRAECMLGLGHAGACADALGRFVPVPFRCAHGQQVGVHCIECSKAPVFCNERGCEHVSGHDGPHENVERGQW